MCGTIERNHVSNKRDILTKRTCVEWMCIRNSCTDTFLFESRNNIHSMSKDYKSVVHVHPLILSLAINLFVFLSIAILSIHFPISNEIGLWRILPLRPNKTHVQHIWRCIPFCYRCNFLSFISISLKRRRRSGKLPEIKPLGCPGRLNLEAAGDFRVMTF